MMKEEKERHRGGGRRGRFRKKINEEKERHRGGGGGLRERVGKSKMKT